MKILTDSAADLPGEETRSFRIQIAPLTINFSEEEISSEQLTPDEFYNRLRVSPVSGVHTGPGVIGAAVLPAGLMEGWSPPVSSE